MKPVREMEKYLGSMTIEAAAIEKIEKEMDEKIAAMTDKGLDPTYVKKESKALRAKAATDAIARFAKIEEAHKVLSKERTWWADTEFCLSMLPMDNKVAYIQDAERMSTSLLAMHIHHANENGELVKLYMLGQEMNRRPVKPEGWRGVDFGQINLPIQKDALNVLSTAQSYYDKASLAIRKISGTATAESIAIQKLAFGHANANEGK